LGPVAGFENLVLQTLGQGDHTFFALFSKRTHRLRSVLFRQVLEHGRLFRADLRLRAVSEARMSSSLMSGCARDAVIHAAQKDGSIDIELALPVCCLSPVDGIAVLSLSVVSETGADGDFVAAACWSRFLAEVPVYQARWSLSWGRSPVA